MPSFDIVSEVDMQEVKNAVQGALREIGTRFDFKGTNTTVEEKDDSLVILAPDETKRRAVEDLLKANFVRRKLDAKAMEFNKIEQATGNSIRQTITIKQGLDQETAKKITKMVKDKKLKVQASIRGQEVRVDGKKRDDLQTVMAHVKEMNLDLPLQFINFRD